MQRIRKTFRHWGIMMAMVALIVMGLPAALSADANIPRKEPGLQSFPVYQSTTIYKGGLVCVNSSGYLVEGTDSAAVRFVGIAYEGADNSSGSDGDVNCRVYTTGTHLLPCTSITQAMVGRYMYLVDDATVDESGRNLLVGRLVEYVSATSGWVDIGQRGIALDNAPANLMRNLLTGYSNDYGAVDYGEFTANGASGGHTYGRGSWITLASGAVPAAGHIHVPWEGGIYDAGATLTNARLIFGAQYQAILAGAPASLHAFRFNVAAAGGAITAIIAAANPTSIGYNAGESKGAVSGTIPLADIVGVGVVYVDVSTTSS